MKKLTDEELDSVFKNAADGLEPAFDPASWEAMKTKLYQPKPVFWKRWMSFTLAGLVIFSSGIWLGTYLNERASKTTQKKYNNVALAQEEQQTSSTDSDKNQGATPLRNQQHNQSESQNIVIRPSAKGSRIVKNQERVAEGNGYKANRSIDHLMESGTVIKVADNDHLIDETAFISREEQNVDGNEVLITDHLPDSSQSKLIEVKEDTTQSVIEEKSKNEKSVARSFYVRLLASPDFSSMNFSSPTSAGSNYALLLEYQLSNRWSISTGGILSKKKYSTDEKFTYGKYTADRMAGACRILDIPINIYYHFRPQQRTSFYAGIGFSSYVMLEEDYTYTFDTPTGSKDFTSYIERQNNEWFKMLNISAGVQYRISPRFYVQAEPFLKAPLTGVGEWDVSLSSVGVFMGLKYKIN